MVYVKVVLRVCICERVYNLPWQKGLRYKTNVNTQYAKLIQN